jgi:peroxiredoxin
MNTKVVALSVDDGATTLELITKNGLEFPVGQSADAQSLAEQTGAIGRLIPDDVVSIIRNLSEHAAS